MRPETLRLGRYDRPTEVGVCVRIRVGVPRDRGGWQHIRWRWQREGIRVGRADWVEAMGVCGLGSLFRACNWGRWHSLLGRRQPFCAGRPDRGKKMGVSATRDDWFRCLACRRTARHSVCGIFRSYPARRWNSMCAGRSTGSKLWETKTDGVALSPAVVGKDGTVYVGGGADSAVYALDGETGRKRWDFRTGSVILFGPALSTDGTLYVGTGQYTPSVYAISTSSAGLASSSWPMLGQNPQRTGRAHSRP